MHYGFGSLKAHLKCDPCVCDLAVRHIRLAVAEVEDDVEALAPLEPVEGPLGSGLVPAGGRGAFMMY